MTFGLATDVECGSDVMSQLIRRARQAMPFEACGFVLNHREILEVRNTADNPHHAFVMDRQQLDSIVAPRYNEITSIWHTHPSGTTWPSPGDLKAMKTPGWLNPNWQYWIVTVAGVFNWPIS